MADCSLRSAGENRRAILPPMKTILHRALGVLFSSLLIGLAPCRADYALRDGDRVVFLGDSITAARRHDRIIENFTLLRFPRGACLHLLGADHE